MGGVPGELNPAPESCDILRAFLPSSFISRKSFEAEKAKHSPFRDPYKTTAARKKEKENKREAYRAEQWPPSQRSRAYPPSSRAVLFPFQILFAVPGFRSDIKK